MSDPLNRIVSGDAGSIREARHAVRRMLEGVGCSAAAELLTDELATNAVRHGGGWFAMTASLDGRRLHVIVSDGRTESTLEPNPPGHEGEVGRGLTIVNAMASAWGVNQTDSGKAVWFELDL